MEINDYERLNFEIKLSDFVMGLSISRLLSLQRVENIQIKYNFRLDACSLILFLKLSAKIINFPIFNK